MIGETVACLAARNNESLVGSVGSLATSWTVKIVKLLHKVPNSMVRIGCIQPYSFRDSPK